MDGRDAAVVEAFAEFLENPMSRCCICLGTEIDDATVRKHPNVKGGKVVVCVDCQPKK